MQAPTNHAPAKHVHSPKLRCRRRPLLLLGVINVLSIQMVRRETARRNSPRKSNILIALPSMANLLAARLSGERSWGIGGGILVMEDSLPVERVM